MSEKQFSSLDQGDPMVARILDAGEQCINRFGIRRTSMGEVARVAGVSRGSVYRYFADKESLIDGVFRRTQEQFLNRTEAQLEREATLIDKVTGTVIAGRKDMREGIFAALAETEPETVAMMFLDPRFYQRSVSFWPPHVQLAKAAGEIGEGVDVAFATDLIMRLAVSLVMFPRMGIALNSRKALRAYIEKVLCQGLGMKLSV